jgi:PEP-CTERM motif
MNALETKSQGPAVSPLGRDPRKAPEPESLFLFGTALAGYAAARWMNQRNGRGLYLR